MFTAPVILATLVIATFADLKIPDEILSGNRILFKEDLLERLAESESHKDQEEPFIKYPTELPTVLTGLPTELPPELPTESSTELPTELPTELSTEFPTDLPTESSTDLPTESSTDLPTESSTDLPTESSTDLPTQSSTDLPTESSTDLPTELSTDLPTELPTDLPTESSTDLPTELFTDLLTESSTDLPTESSTDLPTESSTDLPTELPTKLPIPTELSTYFPTELPTQPPTELPVDPLLTERPDPGHIQQTAIQCNTVDELVSCTRDEFQNYGCCPLNIAFNPSCDINNPSACPPNFRCIMYQQNTTHFLGEDTITITHDLYKCQAINPYENVTIRTKGSRGRPRLGKPCNKKLYDRRMQPIWEKYLLCPWDPEPYQMFEKLKDDWHINNDIMNEVCLSPFIEQCGLNNTCECFSKVFRKKNSDKIVLNFIQVREHKNHCGLMAGNLCTHNSISRVVKDSMHCGHVPTAGDLVPEPFDCERDAACEINWNTRQCALGRKCRCKCAVGVECMAHAQGDRTGSGMWISISMLPSFLIILCK